MVMKRGTLQKVGQKFEGSFEMWYWRRMEKIRWTDHVRNEGVLQRVKEDRNVLQKKKQKTKNKKKEDQLDCSHLA